MVRAPSCQRARVDSSRWSYEEDPTGGTRGADSHRARPTERVSEIKGGKKRFKEKKLYPGYIIVEMELSDEVWYLIKDTHGIGDFVGSYENPQPLSADEVEKILNTIQGKEETPEVKIDLAAGDGVKIKEGPFENFDGTVDEVFPAKGQVRVIVTIFGRPTPCDLEYWQVEKI